MLVISPDIFIKTMISPSPSPTQFADDSAPQRDPHSIRLQNHIDLLLVVLTIVIFACLARPALHRNSEPQRPLPPNATAQR
jgi:hypothetical protein